MAADGSIVIETNIDDKKVQQELNRLNRRIQTLNDQIYVKQQQKMPLVEQAQKLGAELDVAKAKLYQMQNGDQFYTSAHIKEQEQAVNELQKEWDRVNSSIDRVDSNIQQATLRLNLAKEQAGEIQQNMARTGPSSRAMADAMEKMEKSARRFSSRLREVVRSALIFTVISRALASLRDWMGNVIKTNDEASAAFARLKGALLTLAQPLVNVTVPAFTALANILTRVISLIAQAMSALFGTTIEQSAESAEELYNEANAIESVGSAAKSAKKDLAAFDEINKLTGGTVSGGSGTGDAITPDFSFLKDGILSSLTFTLEDVLFNWNDLTAEDILAKIITLLTAIAGGVIGFSVGGVGGSVIGIVIGAGLGLLISDLTFDGDGQLNQEEILRSILLVLGMLVGGVLGFFIGGPGGSAIGILIGTGVTLAVGQLIFNGDGQLNPEEILGMIVTVLGAIVGGIAGFIVGGPGGAAIGVLLGAGIGLGVSNLTFNGDSQISQEEIVSMIVTVLGAIVGGVIGFVAGGPGGALVGILVGAGATAIISNLTFNEDGSVNKNEVLNLLINTLTLICGGLLGFALGGPAGALIGITAAAGLNILISEVSFSSGKFKNSPIDIRKAGIDYGESAADGITSGAKKELGINSPSTAFEDIADDSMAGYGIGINNNAEYVQQQFSSVLQGMENAATASAERIKGTFLGFLTYLATEFSSQWDTTWNRSYSIAAQNIQGVISEINALNARLASIERNITITITTVYKTIGSGSSSGSSSRVASSRTDAASTRSLSISNIPALARGAVIPPNREFLAVLGDQKQGTNIETPLSTMVQAFKTALSDMGYGGEQTVILQVDKDQLGKVVYRLNKAETRRIGVNLTGV